MNNQHTQPSGAFAYQPLPQNTYPNLPPHQPQGRAYLNQQLPQATYSNQPASYLPPNQYNQTANNDDLPLDNKQKLLTQQIATIDDELKHGRFRFALFWYYGCLGFVALCLLLSLFLTARGGQPGLALLFNIVIFGLIMIQFIAEIVALKKKSYGWAMTGTILFLFSTIGYIALEAWSSSAYVDALSQPLPTDDTRSMSEFLRECILIFAIINGISIWLQLWITIPLSVMISDRLHKRRSINLELALIN